MGTDTKRRGSRYEGPPEKFFTITRGLPMEDGDGEPVVVAMVVVAISGTDAYRQANGMTEPRWA